MTGRHLHELLREEQEPFALSRFIDERRCQLRRPHSGNRPQSGLHRHAHPHHHLQIKRHVSDVSENRAFSPSALVKSPSSPFIPGREPFDAKRSPLLHLPVEKSPSAASRITAALLLEAAMRIQRQQEQEQQQPGGKKRRKRRKKKETDNPSRRFGLGFLACMLKRLVVGKRQRGITGEEEAAPPFDVPAKDLLQWDARYGENAVERAVRRARHQQKEADLDMGDPHCGSQTDQDQHRKNAEERSLQRPTCHRCGIPECPQSDGGAFPSVSGRASAPAGRPSTSSPPPSGPSPPPRGPSPELQTPAASPDQRRTETQLYIGGTGDDGRPATTYYEEKKEQFSPVSVLDPPSDEEDHHHHHHHRQHSPTELDAQVEQQEQQTVEEDDEEAAGAADVDSFQHSLAAVQRAKQQLLSRLRRFERLAELDPVELERRLAEEDDEEEDEDGGDSDGRPEAVGSLQDGAEAEAPEVCELVRAVLGLPGGSIRKIPADTRRLVLDLAEEEWRGRRGVFWGPAAAPPDGVERTAEGVRRRFEAWKGVESDTIDMMVEVDLRQEGGDGWRMFPDEVREAAAEVETAAFASLVDELMDELVG